jgi:hypothetical protein
MDSRRELDGRLVDLARSAVAMLASGARVEHKPFF